MPTPILATKLYIPRTRPRVVPRPRLIERLNEGFASGRTLTLISAPAGFGKTTLASEWVAGLPSGVGRPGCRWMKGMAIPSGSWPTSSQRCCTPQPMWWGWSWASP